MYKGGKVDLGKYATDCSSAKPEQVHTATEQELATVGLLRILRASTSLEELHLQYKDCFWPTISPAFIGKILAAAPHLRKTLKVLSLSPGRMDPDALPLIGQFKMLERLDLSNCFTAEYYQDEYDYDDYEEPKPLPYDAPLSECVSTLDHLQRLDLGHGDGESKRYLHDYMVSENVVTDITMDLYNERNGRLTMDDCNKPERWPSLEREIAAKCHALVCIMQDEDENEDIRAMAKEEAKTCPTCETAAKKRCTGCKRQWYCSEECQKKDFRMHKRVCMEKF